MSQNNAIDFLEILKQREAHIRATREKIEQELKIPKIDENMLNSYTINSPSLKSIL